MYCKCSLLLPLKSANRIMIEKEQEKEVVKTGSRRRNGLIKDKSIDHKRLKKRHLLGSYQEFNPIRSHTYLGVFPATG